MIPSLCCCNDIGLGFNRSSTEQDFPMSFTSRNGESWRVGYDLGSLSFQRQRNLRKSELGVIVSSLSLTIRPIDLHRSILKTRPFRLGFGGGPELPFLAQILCDYQPIASIYYRAYLLALVCLGAVGEIHLKEMQLLVSLNDLSLLRNPYWSVTYFAGILLFPRLMDPTCDAYPVFFSQFL